MAYKGIQNIVLFGRESSWGTAVSATKYIGALQSLKPSIDAGAKEHHGVGSYASCAVSSGLLNPKLSMDFLCTNGRFLEYFVFGGTTTHATTSSDTVHTMVAASALPSSTIEESYEAGGTDVVNKWAGFIADSCNLSLNVDGELTASVSGIAKDLDASATTASAAPTQNEIPIKGFSGSLNIGGAITEVQSWTINISRNAKVLHGCGARVPAAGASHLLNVSFTARMGYSANTYDAAILGANTGGTTTQPTALSVTLGADNGVVLGSGKRAISVALTNCQYSSVSRDVPLNDFVLTDISGVGQLSTTTFTDGVTSGNW